MTAADAPTTPTGGLPPVGSLAEEAAQLLDALAARLALVQLSLGGRAPADPVPAGTTAGGSGPQRETPSTDDLHVDEPVDRVAPVPGDAEPATGHTQCVGWCPVCRSADLLRGERPEVAGKLVESAMVVIGALRSLLPAGPAADPSASGPAASAPATSAPAASAAAASRASAASGRSGGTPPPGIERIDIR